MSAMSDLVTRFEEHTTRLARDAQHRCISIQTQFKTLLKDANIQPKAALYAALFFATFTWLAITLSRLLLARRRRTSRPSTPNLEKRSPFKAPDRPPGGMFIPIKSISQSFFPPPLVLTQTNTAPRI